MADLSVEEFVPNNLVTSKPFRFVVGAGKKEFMMHSNLVANMSYSLDAMINGSMKEAREGVAHLSEVEEDTFTCFFQFAYRGDYEVAGFKLPLPKICEDPQRKTLGNSPQSLSYCNKCKCKKCKMKSGSTVHDLWGIISFEECCSTCGSRECTCPTTQAIEKRRGGFRNYGINDPKVSELWKSFVDESGYRVSMLDFLEIDETPGRCWSDIFLAHARVYIFADCYAIDALAELSGKKLHRSLVLFELTSEGVDHITMVVDYVWRNTYGDDHLRTLLCRYCAYNIQQLSPNDKFSALLAEMGDFSSAVIKQLLERLS